MKKPTQKLLLHAKGCLLGLAVGDALGTTLCMFARDRHPPMRDMTGYGQFNLQPGYWTDDTAMAIALADSLLRCNGFDPHDVMDSWWRWLEKGDYSSTGVAIDVGKTIFRALMHYKRTGELYGFKDNRAAGNGAAMRLAPVVLRFLHDPALLQCVVVDQTRLTHPSDIAIEGSILLSEIIAAFLQGASKDELFSNLRYTYQTEMRHLAEGAFLTKTRDQILSGGYVLESLDAALWSFYTTDSFEEALLTAVHLCGDADTVGAITGQIAGAYYGHDAIPERWLEPLHQTKEIEGLAEKLVTSHQ